MTNRFIQLLWSLPTLVGGILLFCLPIGLYAQTSFFNFSYSGPSVVSAGPGCSRTLASAISPLPLVTSTVGATITMSMQDPVETTDQFAFNDPIPAPYMLAVGWLVKDNQGHLAHFYFPITILDNTPPVFDLTNHPATLNLGSVVQVPAAVNPPVSDNCTTNPNQIVITFTQTTPPDTCEAGTYTRTWKATDLAGNTTTFTQTINITADMLPPLVGSPPQNGSAPCAQLATAYPAWLALQLNTNFMVSDVSGIKSITSNGPATFPPGCAMPLVVTFRATDNCNLFTTRTATFNTSDTQPPVVAVEAKDTVGYCSPTNGHLAALNQWINKHGYQQSSDPCTLPSLLTYSMRIGPIEKDSAQVVAALLASFANGCSDEQTVNQTYEKVHAKVTVEFLVSDACGNQSSAGEATFRVIDTLPPIITGVNKTEECGGGNDQTALNAWINAHGNATVTDGCSGTTWTGFSFQTSTGQSGNGSFNSGPYPMVVANNCSWYVDVAFRSTDDCGNVGSKTLRFEITDNTPPIIGGFTPITTIYCPNTVPANPTATATDNCDASVALVHSAPSTTLLNCSGRYDVSFTWTAMDDCGNTSTAIQTFQVRDTTGPVFTLVPGPKTFRCDTFVLPPPVVKEVNIDAEDECSVVLQNITTQIVSNQNPDPTVCGHYNYQITRIFTASDDCGNMRTATQVLTIVDNLGPVPAGTLDTTVVCEVTPMVSPPKAIDACAGLTAPPVFLNQVITPGVICENNYLVTLNWRAEDVCGNPTFFTQTIHVQDITPPTLSGIPANITVECDAIPAPPDVSSFTAADNCDQSVSISLAESETRDPDPTHCAHWTNYLLHRTWTAADNCGNTRAYTQTIHIEDHTGPILILPTAMQFPNDAGDCGADILIPAPLSVHDGCTSLANTIMLSDTVQMVQTSPGAAGVTPVDTVVLHWTGLSMAPNNPVTGNATLTIYLDKVDSEVDSERFTILGEDNQPLGTTELVLPLQCGSSVTVKTIPAAKLNAWLTDGQLTLRLAPNGAGGNAANDICGGSQVRATLDFPAVTSQVPVSLTYQLDNNVPASYPPAGPQFISAGTHTILYTATDCAGNSTTATLTLTVQDMQPPVVSAPAPLTAYVMPTNCLATVTLPFPGITDNCFVSGNWSRASAILNIAFQNDPNAGWIPKNTTIPLTGLIPNAVGPGKLTIRHKGDNGQTGEFFTIYDENNITLTPPNTSLGPVGDQCMLFHESYFTIPANKINAWAGINGLTSFKAIANNVVPTYTDFISPCGSLQPNLTDGVSQIQAVLEYSYAHVNYEITKGGVPIQSDTLRGNQTTVTLPPGVYTVKYRVTDNSGLEGMTTFLLTVRDTVKPKALCVSKVIQTNPSGLQPYILLPSEINNNSVDNCSGTNLTYSLSKDTFTCNQAPNNYPVVLTVTDSSGNSSTCTSLIKVETITLHPYYDAVCENGTLQLYADPLLTAANNIYQVMWTGPNNLSTTNQLYPNLTIPTATSINEGNYTVKITGLSGCMATGNVIVDLSNLPDQPMLLVSAGPYCFGNPIMLSTPSYNGQNVLYQWYEGNQASATLLASIPASNYTITNPSEGPHQYFVKITGDNCTSVNSDILFLNVSKKPDAIVETPAIVVCSGSTVNLGTPVMGNGITYSWSGPCGFTSNLQYPPIPNISTACAGTYSLTITSNGCPSAPATVTVTVKNRPAMPQIAGNGQVCEGATVTLVGSTLGSSSYLWHKPGFDTTIQNINTLTIPNITVGQSASWQLTIDSAGCQSAPSLPFLVQVQAYPNVTATSNSPLCSGTALMLQATSIDSLAWTWTGPNGFVRFEKNPTVKPAISGQYMVVGKTTFGCADTAFVNVLVVQPPVIDTVFNTAPICASCNSNASLQSVIQPIYGPLTYIWTGPPSFSPANLPNPPLPGICDDDNGIYSLIVKDTFGCASQPKSTVVHVQKMPVTPNISPTEITVCQGDLVSFTVTNADAYSSSTSVRYQWFDSTLTLIKVTFTPSFTVGPVSGMDAGNYTVSVVVDSCVSPMSGNAHLKVIPTPSAPSATAVDSTLCEGDNLELLALPATGATFEWISIPPKIHELKSNPIFMNVDLSYTRLYVVRRTVNGCLSAYSEPLSIVVKPRPPKPFLLPAAAVCKDDPNAMLILCVQDDVPGAMYQFFNFDSPIALGPFSINKCIQIPANSLDPGINNFYVVTKAGDCESLRSDLRAVQVDTNLNITAFAGPDITACASPSHALMLNAAADGTGTWIQIGGPSTIIVNPNNHNTQVTGAVAGNMYQFLWTLSNGACKNYSSDTVKVTAVGFETAMVDTTLIKVCGTEVELNAVPPLTTTGHWSQGLFQETEFEIVIDNPDSATTMVHNFLRGQSWFFTWTLDDTGCGSTSVEVTVRALSVKPQIGPDIAICTSNACDTTLNPMSDIPNGEIGRWFSNDQNLAFSPSISIPYNEKTSVCNLKEGPNEIYWVLNENFCPGESTDTIIINFGRYPTTNGDSLDVPFGQQVFVDALQNDILPPSYQVTIVSGGAPEHGNFKDLGNGQYEYQPFAGYVGMDRLIYKVCNITCPDDACSVATVKFFVKDVTGCPMPTLITPNGDDINDALVFPCLFSGDNPNNSELTVFNQWGNEVYHALPYDNTWEGTYNGEDLPVGTYFYVLKADFLAKPTSRFLIIQR